MTRHTLRFAGFFTATLLVASLATSGCSSPRRRWTPDEGGGSTTTGGGTTVAATGVVASGTPREQLEQLDGLLRQQNMESMGPAVTLGKKSEKLRNTAATIIIGSIFFPPPYQSTFRIVVMPTARNPNMSMMFPMSRRTFHVVPTAERLFTQSPIVTTV